MIRSMATSETGTPDRVSRYGDAKPTEVSSEEQVTPGDVANIVKGMKAVYATEKTFSREWRLQQLKQMAKMMDECEGELCAAMQADLHKCPFEGYATEIGVIKSELAHALDHLDEWMKPTKAQNSALNIPCWATTQRDPLGVVLIMGAWNYPMQLTLAPLVGAIAGGNCVVIKPGSYAVASSNALARVIKRYMDPECIRVIEGNRSITSALLEQRFELIFFTGSGYVGRIVAKAAAEHLTPCVLELGGKSPCIVDRSADIEHTVQRLVWATFVNGGQTCVRPDFCMVHEDIAMEFFAQMQKTVREFYGTDPKQTEFFGRLINSSAYKRLSALVNENKDRLVIGGDMDESERYIAPSVFDFGSDMEAFSSSGLMQDELFGPLLPCYRYKNLEEVITFTKNLITGKPLALYAYGSNSHFINQIKTRTTSGGLCINDSVMHLVNHDLPFGGVGSSGMGSYHGERSFNCFTHEKAVLEKSQVLDQSILFKPLLQARFPPYNSYKKTLVRFFSEPIIEKIVNFPIPALRALFKLLILLAVARVLGFKVVRE